MKRTVVLFRTHIGAGSVLLLLQPFFLAGCSGGDAGAKAAGKFGLERSEFIAIKKASKNPQDLEKVLIKRQIEQLQEQGVVQTTPSGKKTNRRR